jgi:rhodanese-related sulfurtransferase
MKNMLPAELKSELAAGRRIQLVDVRETWEFRTAHIDGSTLIPMGEIHARISELDPASDTVVICHHGGRSMQVAAFLERQGFSSVHNLTGGVDAWARFVDPSMPTY